MSWSTFLTLLIIVAVVYNAAVLFVYFKGDVSAMIGGKRGSDKFVVSMSTTDVPTNKKSFVGLVRSDTERMGMDYREAEPVPVISPALDEASNGILVSDLEECLDHLERNLKEDIPLNESTKNTIQGMNPEGAIDFQYDNGKETINKRIDVFENIVQL